MRVTLLRSTSRSNAWVTRSGCCGVPSGRAAAHAAVGREVPERPLVVVPVVGEEAPDLLGGPVADRGPSVAGGLGWFGSED